jgi:hypothetical protein
MTGNLPGFVFALVAAEITAPSSSATTAATVAATATTAAVSTATATITATAAITTTATATATLFTRAGFINDQVAAIEIAAIHLRYCSLCAFAIFHFDKGKTT